MNLTEIAPEIKGSSLLFDLPELIVRQGFCIGQEVIFRTETYDEKVIISGYILVYEGNKLRLRYLVETVASIQQVLEGISDLPDEMLVGIDELICP
jgi:hypothetical protein